MKTISIYIQLSSEYCYITRWYSH